MKSFVNFLVEEKENSVEQYLREFEDAVSSSHRRLDKNGHTFFIPLSFDKKLPNKMIMAALQGDEPGSWLGLMEYVKNNKPTNANVTFLPIFSKEAFRSGNHEDDANQNPNHNIPQNPSREANRFLSMKEMWLPLASEGFLDLHEDPYRAEGYAFVWSDTGGLGDRIVELIGDHFPLLHAPFPPSHSINGRIEKDDQGMLGDYISRLGVSPSITSETPILNFELDKRVEVNVKIIREFLQ